MAVEVKICGVNSVEAMAAALEAGADYVGLVFYPPSPRSLSPEQARALVTKVPPGPAIPVGLLVDADDDAISAVLEQVPLEMLQLHGAETPDRVAEIRARFGLPVMKAIRVASEADVAAADAYLPVADRLLFDAKAPKDMRGALPGGNALAFDWRLVARRDWPRPWMLSGGLDADNVAEAVRTSGARAVDVSSGVEERPGAKSPEKIRAFIAAARALE